MWIYNVFGKVVIGLVLLLAVMVGVPSYALVSVDINRGNVDPLPVAIPYLGAENKKERALSKDIMKVIEGDLLSTGLFRPINRKSFIQKIRGVNTLPDFASWQRINAAALLTGEVTKPEDDKVKALFRLWDVYLQKQVTARAYTIADVAWRRLGHAIADQIYSNLTGEEGYFDSRVVYVSERGDPLRPKKRIAIMDQDGANHRYLTDETHLVLTPRFSPAENKIIYLSYVSGLPKVYMRNLDTGKEEVLGNFPGMSFAPRFSPDGKSVLMSASFEGNSEVYIMDLATRKLKRLTFNRAIDTSPSFSPDGQKIVFNSDRAGSQQLYVMDRDGSNAKRISFSDKGRYATPVWSPRGDLIAFTKMYKGLFYIGVMYPDGTGERLLTESFLDEGPTWSPNGRVIMFSRQQKSARGKKGVWSIYSVDLTGYNEQKVKTPAEASDPSWSNILN